MPYLTIISIITIIILILILIYLLNEQQIENTTTNLYTDQLTLIIIREMLQDVDHILNTNNITYWIDCGTLLGAVRHKNIIPWDDDGDLAVFVDDEQKLINLKYIFNGIGYGFSKSWCGYKIYPLNGKEVKYHNRNWEWRDDHKEIEEDETFDYKYPFIDILLVSHQEQDTNKIIHYSNEKVKNVWPNYYHVNQDLFPLKRYKFDTFELTGPNNPDPYLNRAYGDDWSQKAYKQYDHENQIMLDKEKFDL